MTHGGIGTGCTLMIRDDGLCIQKDHHPDRVFTALPTRDEHELAEHRPDNYWTVYFRSNYAVRNSMQIQSSSFRSPSPINCPLWYLANTLDELLQRQSIKTRTANK